jgi:hypothetical protein
MLLLEHKLEELEVAAGEAASVGLVVQPYHQCAGLDL